MSVEQLNAARELIKSSPEQYPSLVRSVLPIGDRPEAGIRLWCSGFVADFFGAQDIDSSTKDEIAAELLDVVETWVTDDVDGVAKLGICILSEVYQRIYRLTWYKGSEMRQKWERVSALKAKALSRWTPKEKEGIVVACIKFAQVIVLLHQQVAYGHEVLDNVLLTAEAAALLDRLLSVFPNDNNETFGILSATLNATVSLALAQPQMSPKIVSYIMTFDLSKRRLGTPEQEPLVLRWTAKLFKLALHPLIRNFPQLQKYLGGLRTFCANESLKRRAEDESHSPTKRHKPLSSDFTAGPQPYKALYTLVDNMMSAFDARDLQFNLAVNMAAAGLKKVTTEDLDACVALIKERLVKTSSKKSDAIEAPVAAPPAATSISSTAKDVSTEVQATGSGKAESKNDQTTQQKFASPEPESTEQHGPSRAALEVKVPPEFKQFDTVFNRLLGEAPIRVVARLSARGLSKGSRIKEFAQRKLYAQLVPDFRKSLDPLVLWLSEEYYADSRDSYYELVARVVDEIIPKLETADSKIFVRLLSELPELNRDIIFKIRSSCLDPDRSLVGARALKFLIMFKPPCREHCLDLVEELAKEGVQSIRGILERYRPDAVGGGSQKQEPQLTSSS